MDILFGYVGGKTRLRDVILEALHKYPIAPYREPFFGGGAIGIHMMKHWNKPVWVNDKDPNIHALWTAVKKYPKQLKSMVSEFAPSLEEFSRLRAFLLSRPNTKLKADIIKVGFAKLAVHKLSFGCLGTMCTSVRGDQDDLNAIWNVSGMCEKIDTLHEDFKDTKLTNGDFSKVITDETEPALLYLDPPYLAQGSVCYHQKFRWDDHERLSELLKATSHKWVLSYDDHDAIVSLYEGWSKIKRVRPQYSMAGHRKGTELLISSK